MDTLLTWDTLATLAGASGIVLLIVGYTKRFADNWTWVKKIGTDMYAVIISCIVIYSASIATNFPNTWTMFISQLGLCMFNAFVVAAAAGKMNDKAISTQKKEGE